MGHYDNCRDGYCPKCGAAPGNLVKGVCPFCNPPATQLKKQMKARFPRPPSAPQPQLVKDRINADKRRRAKK
jgi:hypothetical protein